MDKLFRLLRYDWPLHFVLLLTNWLPDNVIFLRLRGFLARPFLGKCGKNFRLGRNITFYNPSKISVGRDVYIAYGCWFMAGERITVGDGLLFGPYCVVVSSNHQRVAGSYRFGTSKQAPISIGFGSWVGAHVTITAGSSIGKGSLVAAGAVVNGVFPDNAMLGGVPAKVIKLLSPEPELD